jgi:hypothetical protein
MIPVRGGYARLPRQPSFVLCLSASPHTSPGNRVASVDAERGGRLLGSRDARGGAATGGGSAGRSRAIRYAPTAAHCGCYCGSCAKLCERGCSGHGAAAITAAAAAQGDHARLLPRLPRHDDGAPGEARGVVVSRKAVPRSGIAANPTTAYVIAVTRADTFVIPASVQALLVHVHRGFGPSVPGVGEAGGHRRRGVASVPPAGLSPCRCH